MPFTVCQFEGREFRIEYEKTPITSGLLYHGTLFQEHIFEFTFVIFNNGDPVLFSPMNTAPGKKEVVMEAIKAHEKS